MSELYYEVFEGDGKLVIDGKIKKSTDIRASNRFKLNIFGEGISPKTPDNPLYLGRQLVSRVYCEILNDKEEPRDAHTAKIYNMLKKYNKDIVIVNNIRFDTECTDAKEAINSLYNIINYEAKNIYNVKDVIVFMHISESAFKVIRDNTNWFSEQELLKIYDKGYIILGV